VVPTDPTRRDVLEATAFGERPAGGEGLPRVYRTLANFGRALAVVGYMMTVIVVISMLAR
jgi:hypothetical protein